MTVVRLEEEDLDEEDLAILAEVKKKGYYHGRPKSQACAAPARIEASPQPQQPQTTAAAIQGRAQYDDFQRKWDRFDNETYLGELEAAAEVAAGGARAAGALRATSVPNAPSATLATPAAAEFKLLLAGDGCVGKTALLRRHLTGEFIARWKQTGRVEVSVLRFFTDCGEVRLNVWDLGCEHRHWRLGCIRERDYSQGECAIIMFDVGSRLSYRSLPNWQREISDACGKIPTVILGNKVDLKERQLKVDQITFHRPRRLQYFNMSVRMGLNVERPFLWLLRRLVDQPHLRLVGPRAVFPDAPLHEEKFAVHAKRLQEAQAMPVSADSSGL